MGVRKKNNQREKVRRQKAKVVRDKKKQKRLAKALELAK